MKLFVCPESLRRIAGYLLVALTLLVLLRGNALRAQDIENIEHERAFGLNGAITASLTGYSADGIERRRDPFSWTIVGSPVVSVYGIQMPFNFVISEQERSFRQPFNQFGVSPTYKSVTAHLGYRSMTMGRYTLAGVTFLGAGVEATPSIFRLAGMYGRLQRAVAEDTTRFEVLPAYQRMGYAAKIGIGSEQDYIDLTYFHAKDDTTSLTGPILKSEVYPEENAVFGLNGRVGIIEELSLEAEASLSALTRDLRAPAIVSSKLPSYVNNFLDVKSSSSLALAARAGLNFHIEHFATRLEYERIEPDYTSLGAYYFNTDIENYTLAPAFDAFENKLRLSGSIGIQHDNVLGTKLARTNRVIGSGNVSWNPSQAFGLDAQFTNYSTGQDAGTRPLNDTIRVRNVSRSATFAPRYIMMSEENNQVFSLAATLQDYTDLNAFTNLYSNSTSATVALNYNLTMLKTNRSLGGSLLFANTKTSQISTNIIGGSVNGALTMLENKLTLGASLGYTHNILSGGLPAAGSFNENVNATWQVSEQDGFTLSVYATQNTSSQFQSNAYNELTTTLSYTRSFAF